MLFNSAEYALFFPLVVAAYFLTPHRFRWALLLAASCVFYMYFIPKYLLVLAATIVVDYFAALWIESSSGRRKKTFLVGSILSTGLILVLFKYAAFLSDNLSALSAFLGWNLGVPTLHWILPIGLSFHTFQSLSYVIEVYRGEQKAERHFGIYALYVMFFPQLVAGPIERPQNLLHQFREVHRVEYAAVVRGLRLIGWGLFKKIVIADRLALLVNHVYAEPRAFGPAALSLATVFFAFQIYCDFSGYSDVAIGSARVLGFRLMRNFDRPYSSASIAEFWRRWHISLSTWFRDYVYLPMGGNRCSLGRNSFNLMATFTLSGLWHGANWTYLVWGSLNGVFLVLARVRSTILGEEGKVAGRIPLAFRTAITFVLICTTWVFFRAPSVGDGVLILQRIAFAHTSWGSELGDLRSLLGTDYLILSAASIMVLLWIEKLASAENLDLWIERKPVVIRWGFYYATALSLLFFGVYGRNQFIYFQF